MTGRPRVEVTVEGESMVLVEAARSASGLGLGYFLSPDRDRDRRVALDPGTTVGGLDPASIERLWSEAAPLTVTERRFDTPDGDAWLAQSVGPVWGDGAAAGLTGVRISCLTSSRRPIERAGIALESLDDDDLARLATSD